LTWIFQRDLALADYMAYMAYSEDRAVGHGRTIFSAVTCIFPEHIGNLRFSERALKGWERMFVAGEGAATTWQCVGAIAARMRVSGHSLGADLVLCAADLYLGSSDWALVKREDVVGVFSEERPNELAVLLGVAERGESTKTGTRQGVRPDRIGVSRILSRLRACTPPGCSVFPIDPSVLRNWWNSACAELGYDPGPIHTLRHVGPAHDMAALDGCPPYRTLTQVRVRGRWRAKTSVLRYAKTHALLAARASVPTHVTELGLPELRRLGARPSFALN